MNIKVHEISQVTCVPITYRCQGIRRKPVLMGKWGKRILCAFILGKLRSDNIQGQILPPPVYAIGFHTGVTGQLEFLRCLCKSKFTGEQTLKALLKAKPFSPVTSQESIFFCSGTMLPEKPRSRDFCSQPICPQGAETQSEQLPIVLAR